MDVAFDGISNFGKVVDDCLTYDSEFASHVQRTREILLRARRHGITFSPKKFVFGQPEVQYCGYVLNQTGWTMEEDKVKAIREFPTPQNKTDIKSFVGLVNQFSEFTPRIAELALPLRNLLKNSSEFVWESVQKQAFDDVRQDLCRSPTLSYFQFGAPTRIETDASRTKGLGFALLQYQDEKWRLIQCGSRFLSDAESRYAMIELECLAVVWAIRKCHVFLAGSPFSVVIDHKPLLPILNCYTLDRIDNPRLLRLVMKLQSYQLVAEWRRGKDHCVADALSRSPVEQPNAADSAMEAELNDKPAVVATVRQLTDHPMDGLLDLKTDQLLADTAADYEYQLLVKYVQEGFPEDRTTLPMALHPYWNVRSHLSVDDGIVLKGSQIVIPRNLRRTVLTNLHASHQGRERTQRRARQIVYWPGISNDVSNVVSSCEKCAERQSSQTKEPLLADPLPKLPFQSVSADLFSCQGHQYLTYCDRLSGWPCIVDLGGSTSTANVIKPISRWFSELGVPQKLVTDGGPQFSSREFRQFCSRWQIEHAQSTPHYPQSNGHAEAAIKAVKNLIYQTTTNGDLDRDEFQRGLLEWRNTPRRDGCSPAQVVFGRPLASFLFANHRTFAAEHQATADETDKITDGMRSTAKSYYDSDSRPLSPLRIGTHVSIQDPVTKLWSAIGVVVAVGKRRDYFVKLPSGRVYWRNRRFLRKYQASVPVAATSCPTQTAEEHTRRQEHQQGETGLPPPLRKSGRQRRAPSRLDITTFQDQSYD